MIESWKMKNEELDGKVEDLEISLRESGVLNGRSIVPKSLSMEDVIIVVDVNPFSPREKLKIKEEAESKLSHFDLESIHLAVIDTQDLEEMPQMAPLFYCPWISTRSACEALRMSKKKFFIVMESPLRSSMIGRGELGSFLKAMKIDSRMPMVEKTFKDGRTKIFTDKEILERLAEDLGYCSVKSLSGAYETFKVNRFFNVIQKSSADDCKIDLHEIVKLVCGSRMASEFKEQNWKKIDDDWIKSIRLKPRFLEDSIDSSWLFFKNCVVKIEPSGMKMIPLQELGGGFFVKSRARRVLRGRPRDVEGGSFCKFFSRVCNGDPERKRALMTAMGYLINRFHAEDPRAIVLTDESLEVNSGGTGKGILWHAIEQVREVISMDCRDESNWSSPFKFSEVTDDTAVFVFDEMTSRHWEDVFKTITDGMTVEAKYRGKVTLPPDRSPKIFIATNYPPVGTSSSFERRRVIYELSNYYSSSRTPADEFGCRFFSVDWPEEEWTKFYWFMADCVQEYLKSGLLEVKLKSTEIKKMEAVPELYRDFIQEFMADEEEELMRSGEIFVTSEDLKQAWYSFNKTPRCRRKARDLKVSKDLAGVVRTWCEIKGLQVEQVQKSRTENWERIFIRGFVIKTPDQRQP